MEGRRKAKNKERIGRGRWSGMERERGRQGAREGGTEGGRGGSYQL